VHAIEVPDVPTATQAPNRSNPQATKKKDVVDLNTGIIIAFMADSVVDAIRKNPIGHPVGTK
jgi:hypothetical protein